MNDTTITLDLAKEPAARNAAYTYLRAREGAPDTPNVHNWPELAERVNKLHAEPTYTEVYTTNVETMVKMFIPSEEEQAKFIAFLARKGPARLKIVGVLVERQKEEEEDGVSELQTQRPGSGDEPVSGD